MKSEFFSSKLIDSLSIDNDEAIIAVTDEYERLYVRFSQAQSMNDDFLEAHALIDAFSESRMLGVTLPPISPPKIDRAGILTAMMHVRSAAAHRIANRDAKTHYASKSEEYRGRFLKLPAYEFTEIEYLRIQELIAEIRSEITKLTLIPDVHRRRLLRRLDAMQAELHRKTSDVDRFWGFIGEAGIVARKFGEDLKPLNERVLELGKIVTCVILAKEGIHSLPDIIKILELKG